MSWLSQFLNRTLGIPEVHVTEAEAVSAAISAAKVAIQDELDGKVPEQLVQDVIKAVETSAEGVLTAHVQAAGAATQP